MNRLTILTMLLLASMPGKAQVTITTNFESGSLGSYRLVDSSRIKISDKDSIQCLSLQLTSRPDPTNPIDTSVTPSARWFYFRMTGVKNKLMVLSFQNTDPLRPVYSYDNVDFKRFDQTGERSLRYTFAQRFTRDTVYVSYFTPYTYSYLQQRIAKWAQHPWVKLDTIGYTRAGIPLQRLTVTDPATPNAAKKRVWMHGRIHTSETPASWHFDGFISSLVADNPQAAAYRKNMYFSIVPFANPDGVIQGLSRSNPSGVNIEINWARPEEQTEPEIKAMKAAILKLTADRPLDMLLNMHSQVANKATYWVHTAASTSACFYKEQLALCYLNMFENEYLAPEDLDFSDVAERYAEGWTWKNAGEQTLAITFETPYTFYNLRPDRPWVSPETLRDFGRATLTAVGDYYGISSPERIVVSNRNAKTKGKWEKSELCAAPLPDSGKVSATDLLYLGNLRLKALKEGSRISYRIDELPAGSYTVYRWIPGALNNPADGASCWKPVSYHVQEKNGKCVLQFTATHEGEAFDALLLVKKM